jgi:TolB protein
MKSWPLVLLAWLTWAAFAVAAERYIVFERNNVIYVANLDGTDEKRIAEGIFPAISPDGTRVAFTTVEKSGKTQVRYIAVIEIASANMTIFKDVPSKNSSAPKWSPDGQRILFTLRRDDVWDLATVAPNGTEFRILKKGESKAAAFYSPCWARDMGSIFCQDITNIYQISLGGSVLAKWAIEKVIPNGGMSADGRIDLSPDGKRLLLSIDMGEEHHRPDWDGPPPALWTLEIETQRAVRITPKTLFGWDGCWIDNDNILFLTQAAGEKETSINRMSTNGKDLKRLIRNARMPNVNVP